MLGRRKWDDDVVARIGERADDRDQSVNVVRVQSHDRFDLGKNAPYSLSGFAENSGAGSRTGPGVAGLGRHCSAMKSSTFAEFDPRGLALAEPASLAVWSGLGSHHEELVLVGGLVPQRLCRQPFSFSALPRPGTLVVDRGIALGATAGQHSSLSANFNAQSFRPREKFPTRFEKQIGIYPTVSRSRYAWL